MGAALAHPRPATVWMDVTTSWRSRNGHRNGTLRVEQSYATALRDVMPENLHLCRYNATRMRFFPVATLPNVASADGFAGAADRPVGTHELRKAGIGRRAERAVRAWRRSAASGVNRWLDVIASPVPFADCRPGDVLLLAGETWSRYDFSVLRALRQRCQISIAVICQDMIPVKCPQFFEADGFAERFRAYADFLVADVDLLLAISAATGRDLLEYARTRGGVHGDIQTIELGHDLAAVSADARPPDLAGLDPGSFALSVSTIQSRKNFDLLYQVWRRLSEDGLPKLPKLILVGGPGFGSSDLLWQISHDPVVRETVLVRHAVSDAGLSWLYRNCAWTLYPSFYEGWGLPVSESLAYGKFCIASNATALEEAGQGLVKHIDPLDFAAWRDTVVELVRSPELVLELESRIRARYRGVTWLQSAARLAGLLRPLLGRDMSERQSESAASSGLKRADAR